MREALVTILLEFIGQFRPTGLGNSTADERVRGADRETFGPGDSCSLSAGTLHEEHTGPDGVTYVASRAAAWSVATAAYTRGHPVVVRSTE